MFAFVFIAWLSAKAADVILTEIDLLDIRR
jgi:hypothetical protein